MIYAKGKVLVTDTNNFAAVFLLNNRAAFHLFALYFYIAWPKKAWLYVNIAKKYL